MIIHKIHSPKCVFFFTHGLTFWMWSHITVGVKVDFEICQLVTLSRANYMELKQFVSEYYKMWHLA